MIPKAVEQRSSSPQAVLILGTPQLQNCPDPRLAKLLEQGWTRILPEAKDSETRVLFHQMPRMAASHKDMHLISINEQGVTISAKGYNGFLYGIQSLLQLLYLASQASVPGLVCQEIIDYPAYEWRGLHLDESRHFFGIETVKRYLRIMAALKLNRFHWHLTDDQGWRIESKLYSALCQHGANRIEPDGSSYGGYYTQEEIRHVVAYAEDLGITVIPEIDLPGHSMALLAAYPELACFPADFKPLSVWGISEDILCAGKDEVISFLKNLLGEIAELFTGAYIHLGGDEAPKERWRACPNCQQRIKDLHLENEEQLQSWLFQELATHLQQKGKQVIGWDEILDGNIDSSLTVMIWRGDGKDASHMAARNSNPYILCPNRICYFDWKQSESSPGAHGISTLENVYSFSPADYSRPDLCLGGQANLWTEHIHNPSELEYMLLPRAFALAERLWNHRADFADFQLRLNALEGYLETLR
jgi:hexosaminidase